MKGTFFQKPLEFRLQVDGESWNQGDKISGLLTAKNHGTESVAVDEFRVALAHGELKKVRVKSPEAFKIRSAISGPEGAKLEQQKEFSLPWSFETDRNSPITDSLSSPFLIYGRGDSADKLGQIQLVVNPDPVIQEIIQVLVVAFRFVVKARKFVKGSVEVKLSPPDAKGFVALEQLVLLFRYEENTLHLSYTFGVKKIEATASSFDLKKDKKVFEQSFDPTQYRTPSGRFNHEFIEISVREIISQVESKVLF